MSLAWLQSLCGLAGLIAVGWAFSENRKSLSWRWIAGAGLLQVALAAVILNVPWIWSTLNFLSRGVAALDQAAREGAAFVFGYAGGGPSPFPVPGDGTSVIVAFQILPIVIVTSALAAVLWHWRVLPVLIQWMSRGLRRSLGLSGGAGLGTAANLFFGVVEAPLFIRGVLSKLSRADLFLVMTAGLSTVSGVVLVLYATILEPVLSGATGHIVTASVISLPAAVLMARLLVPETDETVDESEDTNALHYDSSLDAAVQGTMDGMKLYLAIIAVLIVVFAFVSLGDQVLAVLPDIAGAPLTIDRLFGWLFAPVVLLFGIAPGDAPPRGS